MTAPTADLPRSRALLLGRDPAFLAEIVAAALVVANLMIWPELNDVLQGSINAFLLAAAAVYTAFKVKSENLLVVIVGLFKAGIALLVTIGVDIEPAAQGALLVLISLVATAFVRQQTDAPVTKTGHVRV